MATIRDYVRGTMGETYRVLTVEATRTYDGDGDDPPDLVDLALGPIIDRLFQPAVTVSTFDASEFLKSFLADLVSIWLCTSAIDYYMVRTRRSDSMSQAPGITPYSGESSTNYDRVATIQKQRSDIGGRVSDNEADFEAIAAPYLRLTGARQFYGPRISSSKDGLLTQNPVTAFDRPDQPGSYPGAPFGIPAAVGLGVIFIRDTVAVTLDNPDPNNV